MIQEKNFRRLLLLKMAWSNDKRLALFIVLMVLDSYLIWTFPTTLFMVDFSTTLLNLDIYIIL